MKTITQLVLSFIILCVVAVAPTIQAVLPPPDSGYPGGNTAEGQNALLNLTSGGFNTAVGWLSLRADTTGNFNTGIGAGTLFRNNGDENTAVGTGALLSNFSGIQNTATGAFALFSNTGPANNPSWPSGIAGSFNTANGDRAFFSNTTGSGNTAIGSETLASNTTGASNIAIGVGALFGNTQGIFNTALGNASLANNTTGNGNIALGTFAGSAVTIADSVIAIGAAGEDVDNSCYIGQIYSNIQPQVGTDPDLVTINSNGRLGRANVSSRRYKHDIQPMHKASEAIYELKPVSFRYHKEYDQTQTIAFGLIAEEVVEVNPDLVGRNREGQPESVRYEQVNAMLLNEFLKEHKKVEEQNRKLENQDARIKQQDITIAQLKADMETLVARVAEQNSKIQRVSDQVELNKAAPQLAAVDE
jgi:trimeric autotransporter adhesin